MQNRPGQDPHAENNTAGESPARDLLFRWPGGLGPPGTLGFQAGPVASGETRGTAVRRREALACPLSVGCLN